MDRVASEPQGHTSDAHQRVKDRARGQFDRWSLSYDRSWLNELAFFPALRACREEILRWQLARGERPYDLLDVGCGTGRLLTIAAADGLARRLVGVDYTPNMIRSLSEKVATAGLEQRVAGVCGDAERLPLAAESFDVVTCCHSFHHYPEQAAALCEFRRVLRTGGILILVDGFRDNVIGWLIFDVFVERIEKHVHHASWTRMHEMIASAGFGHVYQRKLNVLAPLLVNVARA